MITSFIKYCWSEFNFEIASMLISGTRQASRTVKLKSMGKLSTSGSKLPIGPLYLSPLNDPPSRDFNSFFVGSSKI